MGAVRDIAAIVKGGAGTDTGGSAADDIAGLLKKRQDRPRTAEEQMFDAYRDTYGMDNGRRKRQAAKRY